MRKVQQQKNAQYTTLRHKPKAKVLALDLDLDLDLKQIKISGKKTQNFSQDFFQVQVHDLDQDFA